MMEDQQYENDSDVTDLTSCLESCGYQTDSSDNRFRQRHSRTRRSLVDLKCKWVKKLHREKIFEFIDRGRPSKKTLLKAYNILFEPTVNLNYIDDVLESHQEHSLVPNVKHHGIRTKNCFNLGEYYEDPTLADTQDYDLVSSGPDGSSIENNSDISLLQTHEHSSAITIGQTSVSREYISNTDTEEVCEHDTGDNLLGWIVHETVDDSLHCGGKHHAGDNNGSPYFKSETSFDVTDTSPVVSEYECTVDNERLEDIKVSIKTDDSDWSCEPVVDQVDDHVDYDHLDDTVHGFDCSDFAASHSPSVESIDNSSNIKRTNVCVQSHTNGDSTADKVDCLCNDSDIDTVLPCCPSPVFQRDCYRPREILCSAIHNDPLKPTETKTTHGYGEILSHVCLNRLNDKYIGRLKLDTVDLLDYSCENSESEETMSNISSDCENPHDAHSNTKNRKVKTSELLQESATLEVLKHDDDTNLKDTNDSSITKSTENDLLPAPQGSPESIRKNGTSVHESDDDIGDYDPSTPDCDDGHFSVSHFDTVTPKIENTESSESDRTDAATISSDVCLGSLHIKQEKLDEVDSFPSAAGSSVGEDSSHSVFIKQEQPDPENVTESAHMEDSFQNTDDSNRAKYYDIKLEEISPVDCPRNTAARSPSPHKITTPPFVCASTISAKYPRKHHVLPDLYQEPRENDYEDPISSEPPPLYDIASGTIQRENVLSSSGFSSISDCEHGISSVESTSVTSPKTRDCPSRWGLKIANVWSMNQMDQESTFGAKLHRNKSDNVGTAGSQRLCQGQQYLQNTKCTYEGIAGTQAVVQPPPAITSVVQHQYSQIENTKMPSEKSVMHWKRYLLKGASYMPNRQMTNGKDHVRLHPQATKTHEEQFTSSAISNIHSNSALDLSQKATPASYYSYSSTSNKHHANTETNKVPYSDAKSATSPEATSADVTFVSMERPVCSGSSAASGQAAQEAQPRSTGSCPPHLEAITTVSKRMSHAPPHRHSLEQDWIPNQSLCAEAKGYEDFPNLIPIYPNEDEEKRVSNTVEETGNATDVSDKSDDVILVDFNENPANEFDDMIRTMRKHNMETVDNVPSFQMNPHFFRQNSMFDMSQMSHGFKRLMNRNFPTPELQQEHMSQMKDPAFSTAFNYQPQHKEMLLPFAAQCVRPVLNTDVNRHSGYPFPKRMKCSSNEEDRRGISSYQQWNKERSDKIAYQQSLYENLNRNLAVSTHNSPGAYRSQSSFQSHPTGKVHLQMPAHRVQEMPLPVGYAVTSLQQNRQGATHLNRGGSDHNPMGNPVTPEKQAVKNRAAIIGMPSPRFMTSTMPSSFNQNNRGVGDRNKSELIPLAVVNPAKKPGGSKQEKRRRYKCTLCQRKAMFACSKCRQVTYCSRECQSACWTKHKFVCKK